ncbi:hypothetical protein [Xanthomonas perforans]|uniref:Uncharacterized protein n=8 Tax=Xanthomonas TaxID=338 RepID=A0A6P0F5B6_XANPE|nr:hypothetical protein [Xanthomonas perforans]KLC11504.1 hypothetical protein XP315_00610 [Xanthomonas perforans]KLC68057.1 hypothetical protein GEV839_00890 [Xanthomonas perforans]MBZ2419327.1 hypothetical protein [Xanthomonas perforans]MBZ2436349.1 hypothetical protein [Xanthomonas perforans]MBZ2439362.1 hypothetical protein [Xanthomonas perforans]
MPNLEVIEKYLLALYRAIKKFASRSRLTAARRLFFIALAGVAVAIISVFSFNGLIWYVDQESAQRNKVYTSNMERSRIDRAIDAVSICSKEKEKQSVNANFYCNEAVWRYKNVMGRYESSERVIELVKNKAYEAMQLDMRQHLEDVEAATLRDAENFLEKVFAEFSANQWQIFVASLILLVHLMAGWAMYKKRLGGF